MLFASSSFSLVSLVPYRRGQPLSNDALTLKSSFALLPPSASPRLLPALQEQHARLLTHPPFPSRQDPSRRTSAIGLDPCAQLSPLSRSLVRWLISPRVHRLQRLESSTRSLPRLWPLGAARMDAGSVGVDANGQQRRLVDGGDLKYGHRIDGVV